MHTFHRSRAGSRSLLFTALLLTGLASAHAAPRNSNNTPPVISGAPPALAEVGFDYAFRAVATDADGDPLKFKVQGRPYWASFDSMTGTLRGRPAASDIGTYSGIVISVTDGKKGNTWVSLPAFSITVKAGANSAPVIIGTPPTSLAAGTTYRFVPSASDSDGDLVTFNVSSRPAWASFNMVTGELSGTPSAGDVGVYSNIVIQATDGTYVSALPAFSITVEAAPNQPPTISGSPPTSVTAGRAYSFQPTASDPDAGQTLRFGISNQPAWASFDTGTGRLSGTPTSSNVGSSGNIVISVSDGIASATLPAFTITVTAANRAPTISGTPPTSVTAGQAYSFKPTASDPDGQKLSFSITGKPTWAAFDSATGALTGTPTSSQVGNYANIVISASDGSLSTALPAFSITVADVQTGSATLRWTPPTLNEDGTPLTDLKGYRIYYGTNAASLGMVIDIANPGITSAVVENLSPATWYFALKSYNASSVESSMSNIASKSIQ